MSDGGEGLRSLVVAQDFPWPAVIGSHLRLAAVLQALTELGPTDLFALVPARRTDPCTVPAGTALSRHAVSLSPAPGATPARRLRWLVAQPRQPVEVATARPGPAAADLRAFARPPYDVVWVSKAATLAAVDWPRLGPTVVDLDDLEDRKIAARLEVPRAAGGPGPLAAAQARCNARRWTALQRSVASSVDAVVVCSELDASRLVAPTVRVVPNGYPVPQRPLGRPTVGRPPTVLLAGTSLYPPNADAARWLLDQVLPDLRRAVPDVRVRLVGEAAPSVAARHDPPAVTVVGRVPDMGPELARADLVVAPVRYGSGTRVKVLEAFAHRIPVVATSLGAEGLGAHHGRELLLADEPGSFAAACSRLLADQALRRQTTAAAAALFHRSGTMQATVDAVQRVASMVRPTAVRR